MEIPVRIRPYTPPVLSLRVLLATVHTTESGGAEVAIPAAASRLTCGALNKPTTKLPKGFRAAVRHWIAPCGWREEGASFASSGEIDPC